MFLVGSSVVKRIPAMNMKWIFAFLLLCGTAWGQNILPPVGLPAEQTMGGVTVANLVCDGSTDNAAALQAAITAASGTAANTVYIPPAASACMLASNVSISTNATNIWANPNSVTIKALTGNASSPLLLSITASHVRLTGLTLDGGGTSFASANNVVAITGSDVILDHVTIQNTKGIGAIFSGTSNSGIRDSVLNSVGGAATQGVAFCCGTALGASSISGTTLTTTNPAAIGLYVYGTNVAPDTKVTAGSGTSWTVSVSQTVGSETMTAANNTGNFALRNQINTTGLDAISFASQHDFRADGNYITAAGAAGIYGALNDAANVVDNTLILSGGNGLDLTGTANTSVVGNIAKSSGGSGISYANASHATINGNIANDNNQLGTSGEGASNAGIAFNGIVSNVSVGPNDLSDDQSTPTQKYGLEALTGSTLSAISVSPTITLVGNGTAPYSSLLTAAFTANFFNTTVPAASSAFTATVTTAVASPGVVGWTAHNLACLAPVYFSNSGGGLPTGLTAFAPVYVTCGASLTANTFEVSTTMANALAGTAINFTGSSTGTQSGHYQIIPSSGAAIDLVGVQLPAGNYTCQGNVIPYYGGSTSVTIAAAWISTTGASALPYSAGTYATNVAGLTKGLVSLSEAAIVTPQTAMATAPVRISLTAAGMAILAYQATYSVSSESVTASLSCLRS